MVYSLGHDCSQCVGFCCFALKRNPINFIDPSIGKCRYCTNDGCTIHEEIGDKSPGCVDYTCYGVGNALTRLLQLKTVERDLVMGRDTQITKMFIERQYMAQLLQKLQIFITEQDICEEEIHDFMLTWNIDIRYSLAFTVNWDFFKKRIDVLMQKYHIGVNKIDNSFCRL